MFFFSFFTKDFFFSSFLLHPLHQVFFSKEASPLTPSRIYYILTISFSLSHFLLLAFIRSFILSLSLSCSPLSTHVINRVSLLAIIDFYALFLFHVSKSDVFLFLSKKKKKKRKTLIYYLLNYFLRLFPTSPSLFSFSSSANLLSPGEGRKEKKKDKTGGCDPTSQCPA